ncbi:MAG TPA: proline--tRNA ligase [Acidobacteriota bacterium]|nr:proline--tRNA ligase [Acidobacteriota bacterium]
MHWSQMFIPTLREVTADAEVASHRLLLRAGFIRQLGAGIYSMLPLARRSLLKIEQIIREEMNAIGGQEFYLPALHPAEIWKETGRWEVMGENMFRLTDRSRRELCLGMTHEEVFTAIARDELRSYRDLPQIWYQIQVKFRDEPRPKSGLLRVRQFTMKDSYSFDLNAAGLDASYRLHDTAYRRIFDRCGLKYVVVQAESGAMGGSESEEFMTFSDAGEDWVARCSQCGYAANLERAASGVRPVDDPPDEREPEPVHTPGRKTIQEVSEFLHVERSRQIKSLVYLVQDAPVLVLLRGDDQLNESKLANALSTEAFRPAAAEEIRAAFGADPGSLGPVGLDGKSVRILADHSLRSRKNLICGANRNDYHLLHVTPDKDFAPEYADLRSVQPEDPCPKCGAPVGIDKAIEIGHIFKLGRKYSGAMKATVLDRSGEEVLLLMGSYGIGVERILAAAVELFHDEAGIVLPRSISPFQAIVTLLQPENPEHRSAAVRLYEDLWSQGVDCLLDDRDERPGVKFKDAELIGAPVRITFGRKMSEGAVELFLRNSKQTASVPLPDAAERVVRELEEYRVELPPPTAS